MKQPYEFYRSYLWYFHTDLKPNGKSKLQKDYTIKHGYKIAGKTEYLNERELFDRGLGYFYRQIDKYTRVTSE